MNIRNRRKSSTLGKEKELCGQMEVSLITLQFSIYKGQFIISKSQLPLPLKDFLN